MRKYGSEGGLGSDLGLVPRHTIEPEWKGLATIVRVLRLTFRIIIGSDIKIFIFGATNATFTFKSGEQKQTALYSA